jgi:7,8-dihydropterin-6-yl-methyl-4-(beta-D-ribofuranosyl)aminobenzene 5'-phosphate synthase
VKVTVLLDNRDGAQIKGEWGLSLYIEYTYEGAGTENDGKGSRTVLLDAGLSGLFAENAEKLGLDLKEVDYAVLSHAHDDHANGLDTFLELNDHAPLYVAEGCDENCYDRHGIFMVYAGVPRGIMKRHAGRIVKVGKMNQQEKAGDADKGGTITHIDSGIGLLGHSTPGLDKLGRADKMYLRQGLLKFIPDDFRHEVSLVLDLPEGIVVFNSCSHAGADNIINEAKQAFPGRRILAMIGGFHLFNKTDRYVRDFARRVLETGVEAVYTSHCTGERAMQILSGELGDKMHAFCTGTTFEI